MSVNPAFMECQLVLHEGIKLRLYKDTLGYDTLGSGYNVAARGMEEFERVIGRKVALSRTADCITKEESGLVLRADIARVEKAVILHFPFYTELNEVRQRVVLDMAFNISIRALNFKNCRAYVEKQDWSGATREMYKSKWAYQVDDGEGGKFGRADRLGYMLLTGKDVTGVNAIPGIAA